RTRCGLGSALPVSSGVRYRTASHFTFFPSMLTWSSARTTLPSWRTVAVWTTPARRAVASQNSIRIRPKRIMPFFCRLRLSVLSKSEVPGRQVAGDDGIDWPRRIDQDVVDVGSVARLLDLPE